MSSPSGNNHHRGEEAESGDFAFTAAETGDYIACLSAPEHRPPVTVAVDFDWRSGMAAADWSNVAKKGQIEVSKIRYVTHFRLS